MKVGLPENSTSWWVEQTMLYCAGQSECVKGRGVLDLREEIAVDRRTMGELRQRTRLSDDLLQGYTDHLVSSSPGTGRW